MGGVRGRSDMAILSLYIKSTVFLKNTYGNIFQICFMYKTHQKCSLEVEYCQILFQDHF